MNGPTVDEDMSSENSPKRSGLSKKAFHQNNVMISNDCGSRQYFHPEHVDHELAASSRCCVKACLALLGSKQEVGAGPQGVSWHTILQEVCPAESVVYSFKDAKDLRERAGDNLNQLYVASVNKRMLSSNHAMILWKPDENVCKDVFSLFDPGSSFHSRRISIENERSVAQWSGICAAFAPGTAMGEHYDDTVVVDLIL